VEASSTGPISLFAGITAPTLGQASVAVPGGDFQTVERLAARSGGFVQSCGSVWSDLFTNSQAELPDDLSAHARVACLPLDQQKLDHVPIRLVGNSDQRVADRFRPVAVPPQIGKEVNKMPWLADEDEHGSSCRQARRTARLWRWPFSGDVRTSRFPDTRPVARKNAVFRQTLLGALRGWRLSEREQFRSRRSHLASPGTTG
jgi:hypothetical protein